jgi:hypothetical protein
LESAQDASIIIENLTMLCVFRDTAAKDNLSGYFNEEGKHCGGVGKEEGSGSNERDSQLHLG